MFRPEHNLKFGFTVKAKCVCLFVSPSFFDCLVLYFDFHTAYRIEGSVGAKGF